VSIFNEEYFEGLSTDPQIALHQMCNFYHSKKNSTNNGDLNFHLEFFAVAEAFISGYELDIDLPNISSGVTKDKIDRIGNFAIATIRSRK
jgi:Ca2+-dependent lipid-binding protein